MTIRHDAVYTAGPGRPTVTFDRPLTHPADRVWRAISSPAGLATWFPSPEVSYEERVGGRVTLSGDPYDPEETTTGEVLAWEPPHRFGFEWGGDRLFLSVAPDGDGSVLRLVDELEEEGGAARNASGWDMCLQALEAHLEGRPGGPQEGGMDAFLPVLEAYKAKGFPDDGWLPDEPAG